MDWKNQRFDSFDELYDKLARGHEFEFIYKDKSYFIYNGFIPGTRKLDLRTSMIDDPDDIAVAYNSVDELFDTFTVDGKSFREFMFDVTVEDEF